MISEYEAPEIERKVDWGFAHGSVLRAGTGDSRESAIDALDRRAIYTDAVLRGPEDELVARRTRICGQPQTGASADAADGAGGDLPEATAVHAGARAPHLSIPAARRENRTT